ncbi:hypothetical protein LC613_40765 [Nostoc sphaeroides CHAB 2801]|nr:hypothetical protein [Nostoc sphaeroides]MCC5633753.1 hypothetical protein [Nostoc sphaeroides CHAB 2801]
MAIAALLVWQPRLSFVALSTRGDWMLGNLQGQPGSNAILLDRTLILN